MTEAMVFGERVRELRKRRRLEQRVLATWVDERLRARGGRGFDVTYLSKIENSKAEPPSELAIRVLAEVLETDAEELLALAGKVPQALGETLRTSQGARIFYKSAIDLSLSEADWQHLLEEAKRRRGTASDSGALNGSGKETERDG